MDDPCYLLAPIQSLSDSSLSTHDLTDAYATFTSRIRSHGHLLQLPDTHYPGLACLGTHKDAFIHALRRDVRLAHVDPFSSLSDVSFDTAIDFNVTVVTKQHARDSSSLCHHALCALTTIFRIPALLAVFSKHDLSSLFGDVLDIALAGQLPIPNALKTYSLALWALSCHHLPAAVLSSRRNDVCSALQRTLDRTRQPVNIVLDGIKAISHTMEYHPSEFLHLLFPLLPDLMANFYCESSELRLHACIALGKFANSLTSHPELSLTKWQSLSNLIIFFLEPYCDESQAASEDKSLSYIVRTALSAESHAHSRDTPTWIFVVLSSLIVLCGPTLYTKPTVLRFILQSLAMALIHKRSVIRALHPHVWKCFVWSFSQMLLSPETVDPALLSSAFYVIKQEVSGGIGTALVNILLSDQVSMVPSDERSVRVAQALLIVKAMVQTECKHTCREAFMFLQAFTNNPQVRRQITQSMHEIPASILLNGVIAGAEWDSLPSIIHSIPKVPVVVRWLEEKEIIQHYETLFAIWKHFATTVDKRELDSNLADVWLSILLACSHQLECDQHVSSTTDVLKFSAATITEFLPSVPLAECQPDWGSWSVHDQLCRLTFINQLWFGLQRAFTAFDLTEAAELVLTSILKYAFHVLDPDVRTLWGRLCANLVGTASASFLRDVDDFTTSQLVIRSQRELWGVIATSLSSSKPSLDRRELINFLAIPICTWILSERELEVWEALLRSSITQSGDFSTMTEILQYFRGKEVENWESIIPVLTFLLTTIHEYGNSPADELLFMVDVCLNFSYCRSQHLPKELTRSLELLTTIRHLVVSDPGKVMHILRALRSSLCLWIEDHTAVMSDDQFNSVAVSLYCETLKALEDLPLSIQSLREMESFLASAFSRIPTPAIAPFAFENFWRATYHGHSQFCANLPPKIKSCLTCFVAAYGGDLADGLSSTTESQSQQSISDSFQAHSPTSYQQQRSNSDFRVSPLSAPIQAKAFLEESDMKAAPCGLQYLFADQEATTFPVSSPDDSALRPIILHQPQEYSSQTNAPFLDGTQESTSSNLPRRFSSIPSASGAMSSSRSLKCLLPTTVYSPTQKRSSADDDGLRKRSRISRDVLCAFRELESEPATRDVTPVDVPRMNSLPPKKRMVFDGVHVPTLRAAVRRRKRVASHNIARTKQCLMPSPNEKSKAPPTTLPSPVRSDEDNLDWEDFRVDVTSSEVDVNECLVDVSSSSPLRARTSTPYEPDNESYLPTGVSVLKAMSQSEIPSSVPPRSSLRRTKTTSARLDALQDVYSSVATGASQIPMSELLQATKLVHQIGAVLTEQMGKKMGNSGR